MQKDFIEIIGLFLFMAGYIVGLGGVTVIDLLGALGMKSAYWTEAAIRTHKITKKLIWLGLSLVVVGGSIFYSKHVSPFMIWHIILTIILVLNGLFLSFYVSPKLYEKERKEKDKITTLPASLQTKIFVSFIISFTCWWGSVVLLVFNLQGLTQ